MGAWPFRLDVQYVTDIDLHDGGDAVVPQFASLPQIHHINDRMFYGTFANAEIWATRRFSHAEKYVASHPHIHSETFLSDLLAAHRVHPAMRPICFCRVRATGKLSVDDCDDTFGWHIWHRPPTVCSLPTFWPTIAETEGKQRPLYILSRARPHGERVRSIDVRLYR